MTGNSFLNRINKAAKGAHGTKSEKRVGKLVGGKMTPGSGALPGAKGDVILPDFLMECKATWAFSMKLEHGWLVKITHEALNCGMSPALSLSFTDREGKPLLHGDWVMIPLTLFNELTHQ